jgi:hypothetical protein
METKLDFLIGANTILDSNMLLEYQESEMRAYLKVKNQQFDEKILCMINPESKAICKMNWWI